MAFPLYLSYLTSDQKPGAAACFVPAAQAAGTGGAPGANGVTGQAAGANRSQASIQVQSKAMDASGGGAPVPVVPMDCYEDMFHEIAKKFYGEGALIPGGIVQAGTDQNGAPTSAGQQQTSANPTELGLMDLDYQQVLSFRSLFLDGNDGLFVDRLPRMGTTRRRRRRRRRSLFRPRVVRCCSSRWNRRHT